MAGDTTTVRVRRGDAERLQVLARQHGSSVVEAVRMAVDALERQEFLEGLREDYRRLRADPERWEQYLRERREWDPLD
ncbi:MAG TPA: hypothetical protein VHB02_20265 [Acidimicrobiales bacterium]|nr:hypothetical protein [Acidimicrobiales bacterium]